MFRTETLRTDLAFATNQGAIQASSDFSGTQSAVRANLGQSIESSAQPLILQSPVRLDLGRPNKDILTANRTYFIRTDGSDNNNGLSNSSSGAFASPQKFYDTVASLDKNGFSVTGKLADGTYTITTGTILKSGLGDGKVILEGNTTTPANVILTTASDLSASSALLYAYGQASIHEIKGIRFTGTGSSSFRQYAIFSRANSIVEYNTCEFGSLAGTFSQHIRADTDGKVFATGNYSIIGGCDAHLVATISGKIFCQLLTITLTGTPAFSTGFAVATRKSIILVNGNTFSGSATGKRYDCRELSEIFVNGAGLTYLPGNASGTADAPTYGIYV